jgi:hypothetical protein
MRTLAFAILALAPLPSIAASESYEEFVSDYCLSCHNDVSRTGGLSLEAFDAAHPERAAEIAEKMIRKLDSGMMPPTIAPQPEEGSAEAFAKILAARIDEAAEKNPNPGRRAFQRLNRAEYARSVKDLLTIEVDVEALLPPDTVSHGFDNIADVQGMSPAVMEGYLRAAEKISREAIGDPGAPASETTYKVPRTGSQLRWVEGAPFGTRGGIAVDHNFPADGEYTFRIQLHGSPEGFLYGSRASGERLEVSIDGVRAALLDVDPLMSEQDDAGLNLVTTPIWVQSGTHRVAAAFLKRAEGPIDDVIAPIEHTLADSHIGIAPGITTLPHLRDFTIKGPHRVTGVSDTTSRRRVFTCRPTSIEDEASCSEEIVRRLATLAYRRPLEDADVEGLLSFYATGRRDGDFESGIRMALQAILASPSFVLRLEESRAGAEPGGSYRLSDLDLASRLSFFLWASAPDEELLRLAREEALSDPETLSEQVLRMLRDPRSEALATRFASQWLRLQDLEKLHPDALLYPLYDQTLARSMKRETELFFDNLVREDRSVLELLSAEYTFADERLAKHYGIPNVTGSRFRRVSLEGGNANRRGLLGQGSILALTSVANRTSPVQRGKWVLEVLLGSPPPPPPPNVPALEDTKAATSERVLSVRERMEEHRKNPACHSCHTVIDPIGLALENFDVTGAFRAKDRGADIDTSGELYDGTSLHGPLDLRDALLRRQRTFLVSFTESLLTYALGRRVEAFDMPAVRKIEREAAEADHRMSAFILGVVRSVPFRMSREDSSATENP